RPSNLSGDRDPRVAPASATQRPGGFRDPVRAGRLPPACLSRYRATSGRKGFLKPDDRGHREPTPPSDAAAPRRKRGAVKLMLGPPRSGRPGLQDEPDAEEGTAHRRTAGASPASTGGGGPAGTPERTHRAQRPGNERGARGIAARRPRPDAGQSRRHGHIRE